MREESQTQRDGNWSSFQLAKSSSPQSVIDKAIAPPARMPSLMRLALCHANVCDEGNFQKLLAVVATARTRDASRQKLCCGPTPEEPPKALQTSECDELLDLTTTSCVILVERQPGKFNCCNDKQKSISHEVHRGKVYEIVWHRKL